MIMGLVNLYVHPEDSYGAFARIGYGDFAFSFFSTVSYYLEGAGKWGKKFPRLLLDLCDHGVVEYENLDELQKELETIYKKLKKMPLSKAIYDIEDLTKPMPWDLLPNEPIDSLADLWITPRGRRIYLDIFTEFINDAKSRKGQLLLIFVDETDYKDTLRKRKDKGRKYWLELTPINFQLGSKIKHKGVMLKDGVLVPIEDDQSNEDSEP